MFTRKDKEALALELARRLTKHFIPYHPPLKGAALDRLKASNPNGYNMLQEYLQLEKELKNDK